MSSFTKNERLNLQRRIDVLFNTGNSFLMYPFKVFYLKKSEDSNSLLISTPKRLFKKAVDRNLLKRRIRESYRNIKDEYKSDVNYDIAIIWVSDKILEYKEIEKKLKNSLEKIYSSS